MIIEMIKDDIPENIQTKIIELYNKSNCASYLDVYYYIDIIDSNICLVGISVKGKNYKDTRKVFLKKSIINTLNGQCFLKDWDYIGIAGWRCGFKDVGMYKQSKYYEDGKWYEYNKQYWPKHNIIVNPEKILEIDKYKYSCANYIKFPLQLFKYLKIYETHPKVEYLMKAGFINYCDKITFIKRIENDKSYRKFINDNKEIILNNRYTLDVINHAYKYKTNIEYSCKVKSVKNYFIHYQSDVPYSDKLGNYILNKNIDYRSYIDYYKACVYLELDMKDTKNMFPIDFEYWHDLRIRQYAEEVAKKDGTLNKELIDSFNNIVKKYIKLDGYSDNQYIVILAKEEKDIIIEGEILHHCVGKMGYYKKMSEDKSIILFVRDKEFIDKPFVTVEYDPSKKKILQCYTEYNHKPNDNVINFINNNFLEFARKKRFKKAI